MLPAGMHQNGSVISAPGAPLPARCLGLWYMGKGSDSAEMPAVLACRDLSHAHSTSDSLLAGIRTGILFSSKIIRSPVFRSQTPHTQP